MAINFDSALGVHAETLAFRTQRTKILASNLANVDTPNYKARDIQFQSALSDAGQMARTQHQARRQSAQVNTHPLLYRQPNQPAQDGNTVELGVEQAKFAENAMAFETSLTFLNMKLSGLKQAITGQ